MFAYYAYYWSIFVSAFVTASCLFHYSMHAVGILPFHDHLPSSPSQVAIYFHPRLYLYLPLPISVSAASLLLLPLHHRTRFTLRNHHFLIPHTSPLSLLPDEQTEAKKRSITLFGPLSRAPLMGRPLFRYPNFIGSAKCIPHTVRTYGPTSSSAAIWNAERIYFAAAVAAVAGTAAAAAPSAAASDCAAPWEEFCFAGAS